MHINQYLVFEKYGLPLIQPGMRILEIGGPSRVYIEALLAKLGEGQFTYVVSDFVEENITDEEGLARCRPGCFAEFPFLDVVKQPGEYTISCADESFDVVLSGSVFEHVRMPWRLMGEVARILSPGGLVITSTPMSWHFHAAPTDCYRYYPEAMVALYESCGLETLISKVEHVPHSRRDPLGVDKFASWGVDSRAPHLARLLTLFAPLWKQFGGSPFVFDTISVAVKPLPAADASGTTETAHARHRELLRNVAQPSLRADAATRFTASALEMLEPFVWSAGLVLRACLLSVAAPLYLLTYRRQQLGFLRSREYFGDETDVQSCARVAAAEQMVRAHASVGALRPSPPSSLRKGAQEAQKTIFTFFDKGEDALSPFLKCCVGSWRVRNPGWRVVVLSLDHKQLGAFVDVDVDLPPTFWAIDRASLQADLLRLAVLAKHGGIYVDVSTLCLQQGFADATWRRLESKAYVGYANAEYGQHCLCWFMPMRVRGDALMCAWHQQLMALFRERTSDKGVHADAYFDGIDLSGFISARDDHRDYLVINCVFSAILEKEPELSSRWEAGAHTEPGTAPTAPTNWYAMDFWQPFEPLFEPPVTPTMPFYDMVEARMAKMAHEGDEPWVAQLADAFAQSGTPFVKFCRAGAHFQHLTTEALMNGSRCALARLVRHALSAS